jgi:endonuclease/exonuclease/phosphatase (EEP) superfamily protein YafD
MSSLLQASVISLGVALILASVMPALLSSWWVANLLANLRLHLILLGGVMATSGLAMRSMPLIILGTSVVAVNALTMVASLPTSTQVSGAIASRGATLRVMTLNLLYSNRDLDALGRCLARVQPDLLLVQEVGRYWATALDDLDVRLPYRLGLLTAGSSDRNHGVMLLSRHPIIDAYQHPLDGVPDRLAAAMLDVDGRSVWAASVHTAKPTTPPGLARQQRQLEELAAWVMAHDGPLVLGGDLNTTLHSAHVQDFIGATGVQVDHRAHPWLGLVSSTFPAALPVLGLKIDHIMVRRLIFRDAWTVACPGSDHRAVVADLELEGGESPSTAKSSGVSSGRDGIGHGHKVGDPAPAVPLTAPAAS